MKKLAAIILAIAICIAMCACSKSDMVVTAENAITAIGTVTAKSGDAIENAEKIFAILSDSEKEDVENRMVLVEARTAYDKLMAKPAEKSEAVVAAEEAIAAIGEVSIDSGEAITGAEKLYAVLTDAEKADVENRLILADAQAVYAKLVSETVNKSDTVLAAQDAIDAIGEVTVDSGEAIAYAEKLYGILTESEKADVDNRLTLIDARETFDVLMDGIVYENAKSAYIKLNEVADLCVSGMDAIYGAWYFGIYDAEDSSDYYGDMADEVPGFTETELEAAGTALGISSYLAKYDWNYALYIVEMALSTRGDYTTITNNMLDAEAVLQSLTEDYDDYTYYPKLKEYYSAVKSYVDFFTSPTGSFNQLADTVKDYENNIRTLASDVGFLFNK